MASQLVVKIKADYSSLGAGLRAVESEIGKLQAGIKSIDWSQTDALADFQRVHRGLDDLIKHINHLESEATSSAAKIAAAMKPIATAVGSAGGASTGGSRRNQQIQGAALAVSQINASIIDAIAKVDDYNNALDKIGVSAKNLSAHVKPAVKDLKDLNTELSGAVRRVGNAAASFTRFGTTAEISLGKAQNAIGDFGQAAERAFDAIKQPAGDIADAMRAIARTTNGVDDAMRRARGETQRAKSAFETLTVALGGALIGSMVGQVFWRIGDALLRLPGMMVQLAGGLEQTQIALETMTGSAAKASVFLSELQEFAVRTPFEFEGLMQSSKLLMAMGINARAVIPILTAVGDSLAAVGGSSAAINNVSRALAQMAAKGKLNAEELNQLAENGIPAVDMLAKKIGVTTGEIMKMAEKGSLAASKYLPILINEMERRFQGMMEKQNKTITGSLAMASDAFTMTIGAIGLELNKLSGATDIIRTIANGIMVIGKTIKQFGLKDTMKYMFGADSVQFLTGVSTALGGIGIAMVAFGGYTLATAASLAKLRAFLLATTKATLIQSAALIGIGAVMYTIGVNSEKLSDMWSRSVEYMSIKWAMFVDGVQTGSEAMNAVVENIANPIKAMERLNEITRSLQDRIKYYNQELDNLGKQKTADWVNPITSLQKAWEGFAGKFAESQNMMDTRFKGVTEGLLDIAKSGEEVKKVNQSLIRAQERQANQAVAIANAYEKLGIETEAIIGREMALGMAYDESRALADALTPVISALTARYTRKSAQVQDLIKVQQNYLRISAQVNQAEARAWPVMQKIISVGEKLTQQFEDISREAEDSGEAFNGFERQTKALRSALRELQGVDLKNIDLQSMFKKLPADTFEKIGISDALKKAFASGNVTQAVDIIKQSISDLTDKANQFDVDRIIADGVRALDQTKTVAQLSGNAWDETDEQLKFYAKTIDELVKKGTPQAIKAANEMSIAMQRLGKSVPNDSIDQLISGFTSLASSASSSIGGINDLFDLFGIKLDSSMMAGVEAALKFATSLAAVVTGAIAVSKAIAVIGAALAVLALNPIALALAGIVLGVMAAGAAWKAWTDDANKKTDELSQKTKELQKLQDDYAKSVGEANRDIVKAVADSSLEYKNKGRVIARTTQEERFAIMGLVDRYNDLSDQMYNITGLSKEQQESLRDEFDKTAKDIKEKLPDAYADALAAGDKEWVEAFDRWEELSEERTKRIAQTVEESFLSGAMSAMRSAAKSLLGPEGGNDWINALREGIREAVANAIIEGLLSATILQSVKPQIEAIALKIREGAKASDLKEDIADIFKKTMEMEKGLFETFGAIRDEFSYEKMPKILTGEAKRDFDAAKNVFQNAYMNRDVEQMALARADMEKAWLAGTGTHLDGAPSVININVNGTGKMTMEELRAMTDQMAKYLGVKSPEKLRTKFS